MTKKNSNQSDSSVFVSQTLWLLWCLESHLRQHISGRHCPASSANVQSLVTQRYVTIMSFDSSYLRQGDCVVPSIVSFCVVLCTEAVQS